jgi:NTE family protein
MLSDRNGVVMIKLALLRSVRPGRTLAILLAALLLWVGVVGQAAAGERPRIGLALSGGGGGGGAHLGVLRELERLRIPVDYIAGTSMGAVVGGLYAAGLSPAEIERAIEDIDWVDIFEDEAPRSERRFRRKQDDRLFLLKQRPGVKEREREVNLVPALIQGQKLDLALRRLTLPVAQVADFDDLRIPFRAVATDVVTGRPAILGSGDLAGAIRASMAIPAVFAPVQIGDQLLVDGGIAMNLPVAAVRGMGADIVIAVDISGPRRGKEDITNVLQMLDQIASLVTWRNTEEQLATLSGRDVLIVPPLGDKVLAGDFDKLLEAVAIGVQGAKAEGPALARLSLPEPAYAAFRARHPSLPDAVPTIDYVRVENDSGLSDEVIESRLDIRPGDPLDTDGVERDLARVYDQDNFEQVSYRLERDGGRTGVVVSAKEKPWGTSYLQGGLDLSSTLDGDSFFNIGVAYTLMPVNRWNGEWRTLLRLGEEPTFYTELYQPLDPRDEWYVSLGAGYLSNKVYIYTGRSSRAPEVEYDLTRLGAALELGRNLGRWGRAALTYAYFAGDADVWVGDPSYQGYTFREGELSLSLAIDTMDNLGFPAEGYNGFADAMISREGLGANQSYTQVGLGLLGARSFGRNAFNLGLRLRGTLDEDAPIQGLYRTGGFLNLSGYNQNQLSGQQEGLLRMAYMRKLDTRLVPTYLGASAEWGGVWQGTGDIGFDGTILAGSLFVGADTPLGPVYAAYGRAEGGESAIYFFLGKPWSIRR